MEQSFELKSVYSVVRRRYIYFLVPAAVIFTAAVLVAYLLPKIYEAKATILIESQRIPDELASSTVTASPSERIKVIEQRVMARDNLLEIAERFSLYREDGQSPSPTEIVDAMREAIAINQIDVAKSRRNVEIIGFEVSFQYTSATMASRVANELVTTILSQNLETRLSRATETSDFFQQQLRNLEAELLKLEQKMASFKRENEFALPETLATRRMELSTLESQIAQIDLDLRILGQSGGSATASDGSNVQQLSYRLQMEELNHNAYQERRELLTPLAEKGYVSQKTMADLDRQIAQSEIQIAAIQAEMAEKGVVADPETKLEILKDQKADLEKRAEEIRNSISRTPTVEVELAAMSRDYDNLRDEYRQTKAKFTDAQIGKRMEEDRQAERFEVLEQATVPEEPTKPDRKQIVLAGGGAAIASGLGLVVLLEFLDKSVRTANDLERRLQIKPLAVIPYVTTRRERLRKYLKRGIALLALLTIAVVIILAIHIYYLPLDLIFERVMDSIRPMLPNFVLP